MKNVILIFVTLFFMSGCTQLPEDAVGGEDTAEKEKVESAAKSDNAPLANKGKERPKPTKVIPLNWNAEGVLELTALPEPGTGFEVDFSSFASINEKALEQSLKRGFGNPEIDMENKKMVFQIPKSVLMKEGLTLEKLNEMLEKRSSRLKKMMERGLKKEE